MERKESEQIGEEHAAFVQEKLHLYKQTLEFVKSGDFLQEFIQLKNEFQKLEEQVMSLKEEIAEIKGAESFVTVEEIDVEDKSIGSAAKDLINNDLINNEPVDFKKLSYLLKSTSQLELGEQERVEGSTKSSFSFSKKEMPPSPFSRSEPSSNRFGHAQTSNKQNIKNHGAKKRMGMVQKKKKEVGK